MLTKNAYTYDPIKFNNLNQAQLIYVGVDSLDSPTLAKGKIIVALSGPEKWMIGSYYTDYEELLKNDLDSVKLCQGVQVVPFFDKNVMLLPQYKTNARLYVLNEDINAAVGDTTENSHFGPGGLQQYAIPNGREMINAANEDKEIYNCLMKEYTDELQKNDRNLESMKSLKRAAYKVYNNLNHLKLNFLLMSNEFQKNYTIEHWLI